MLTVPYSKPRSDISFWLSIGMYLSNGKPL